MTCLTILSRYHAVQIIEGRIPSASLKFVVEPWFLGAGSDGPGGEEFADVSVSVHL